MHCPVYQVYERFSIGFSQTHIITQTHARLRRQPRDVERAAGGFRYQAGQFWVALEPNKLAGIWTIFVAVAAACGVSPTGDEWSKRSKQNPADRQPRPSRTRTRRGGVYRMHEPLMAAAIGFPSLVELAGWRKLFERAGLHSHG